MNASSCILFFSETRNHSYHQRIQDLDLISLVQRRQWGKLIEVFKYQNRFTSDIARGLFDYDLNDRTRNNVAKLIVKHFNTSVAQHFYPIKITTTCNALPWSCNQQNCVNTYKNSLDKHWAENPPNGRVKLVAIVDAVHNSSVHKQLLACVLLEMDPTVCRYYYYYGTTTLVMFREYLVAELQIIFHVAWYKQRGTGF